MSEKYNTDTMDAIRAGVAVKREITKAKGEAERLRKEAIAADKHLSSFAKKSRDDARAHTRRCQIVGEVFLDLAADNPVMWTDFKDHLELALVAAVDADRALFSLSAVPKSPTAKPGGETTEPRDTGNQASVDNGQPVGGRRDVSEASDNAGDQ